MRTGIILCGGRSRRFGKDKALLTIGETPMIRRMAGRISQVVGEIITEVSQTEKDLRRKKRAILAVLNKLEEDHDAGAVSDADYKRLSSKYEKQAIEIMKQLDQM